MPLDESDQSSLESSGHPVILIIKLLIIIRKLIAFNKHAMPNNIFYMCVYVHVPFSFLVHLVA